jgi:hypothetical protein
MATFYTGNVANTGNTTASRRPVSGAAMSQAGAGSAQAQTISGAQAMAAAMRPQATAPAPASTILDEPTYYGSSDAAPVAAPVYDEAQAAIDALNTPEYVMAQQQLANALGLFKSQQSSDRQRFDVNYERALRNLGWIPEKQAFDRGELRTSEGIETASGKAFTDSLNDFAARGLSQSGMFSVAQAAIQKRLNDQRLSAETGRSDFLTDQERKGSQFVMEQEAQRQQALNAAKQGLLNQYLGQSGLGG